MLTVLFLLGVTAQALSGIFMQHNGAGWTPASVQRYYLGDVEAGTTPTGGDMFGEGDPDGPPAVIAVGKPLGALMEVAHFHLVAMPLLLFVIAHLFSMTPPGRARAMGWLCYGSFAAAFLDIAAPFLVRFVSGGFAVVKIGAFLTLQSSLLLMTLWTLYYALTVSAGKDTQVSKAED